MKLLAKARGFELIHSPLRQPVSSELSSHLPIEKALFANFTSHILIIVDFSRVTDGEFIESLEIAKPLIICDLRKVPRFDVGSLNRQKAFEAFFNLHIQYVDYAHSHTQVAMSGVDESVPAKVLSNSGPIMILLDHDQDSERWRNSIINVAKSAAKPKWSIVEIPCFKDVQIAYDSLLEG